MDPGPNFVNISGLKWRKIKVQGIWMRLHVVFAVSRLWFNRAGPQMCSLTQCRTSNSNIVYSNIWAGQFFDRECCILPKPNCFFICYEEKDHNTIKQGSHNLEFEACLCLEGQNTSPYTVPISQQELGQPSLGHECPKGGWRLSGMGKGCIGTGPKSISGSHISQCWANSALDSWASHSQTAFHQLVFC